MALRIFTPPIPPSPGTSVKPKLRVLKAQFGDGYQQTTHKGLGSRSREIQLTWETLLPDQAKAIISFFLDHAGDVPFYYTPSDAPSPIKWKVTEFDQRTKKGGLRTVTASFEQSFDPER